MHMKGKRVAILATHGFEQSELEVPRDRLKGHGALVHIVSPESGQIRGWDMKDWGRPVPVDVGLDQAKADDYDAIVLPGGQINPDLLRINDKALKLIRAFYDQRKVVAAICHAPWLLIETGIIKGGICTGASSGQRGRALRSNAVCDATCAKTPSASASFSNVASPAERNTAAMDSCHAATATGFPVAAANCAVSRANRSTS